MGRCVCRTDVSNLHNLGRFIVDFIKAAMERQAYGLVVHYQTDLAEIQSRKLRPRLG